MTLGKESRTTYILTNNPQVVKVWASRVRVDFIEAGLVDFYKAARDRIHEGEVLLSHPLSSSIKPGETPYKSLLIKQADNSPQLDFDSLDLIEAALAATEKFLQYYGQRLPYYSERVHRDFQLIDLSVINSALESAGLDSFALETRGG
ncbi:MAG: GrdX family protein [Eubacteriales bacterium]|nr:GrdX family protein [Eubacteriales bacterium]